jgi:hypothetical protein
MNITRWIIVGAMTADLRAKIRSLPLWEYRDPVEFSRAVAEIYRLEREEENMKTPVATNESPA